MQLLAADYQNIGPFEGARTVIFQQHATLIQAPVGSGKSFLFFDGVVFGLYKYSQRPLLHRHAEQGTIAIVFEQQGTLYVIHRSLSHGKTKDRTQSTLYRLGDEFRDWLKKSYGQTVLHRDDSLWEGLQASGQVTLTEIPTKTDTELQGLLDELLPPRTVFTHTQLLLQDSDNIFTMSPAERITVFQHLFALLDVDVAKDMVADAKKETQTRIRILSDTSRLETKYRQLLTDIDSKISSITDETSTFAPLYSARREPIESLDDLAIEATTLPENRPSALNVDIGRTQQNLEHLLQLQAQREQHLSTLTETRAQITTLNQQSQNLQHQIQSHTQALQSYDPAELLSITTKREEIRQHRQSIISSINRSSIRQHLEPRTEHIESLDLSTLADHDPQALQQIISQLITYGKELRTDQQHAQQLTDQARKQKEKDLAQTSNLIQSTIDHITTKKSQLTDLNDHIHNTPLDRTSTTPISCPHCYQDISDVIWQHCAHQDQAGSLRDTLLKQRTTLESEIISLENILKQYQSDLQQIQSKEIPTQSEKSTQLLARLAQTMTTISRQEIQQKLDEIATSTKDFELISSRYESLRQQADTQQSTQLALTKLHSQKESIDDQIASLRQRIQTSETTYTKPDPHVLQQTQTKLKTLQSLQTTLGRLTELHDDLHHQILERKDLELRDTKLKNLHHILSKEIMYIVLENALPSLFAIINALLAQVVDYQLHFALIKTGSDRLELEVEVEDAKGRRPTSSLSGGQKVILKLAWILAVASYMRLPLLLLDETINNLDADLIARVAELIDDVIRKQEMTLYVVTHSPHIQQMNVWEEIVEVR